MQNIIFSWKKIGETPLDVIKRIKKERPELREDKMTYAGRLDPLAEGVLPILYGNDVHKKSEITSKSKKYEVTMVCGISTDTYDSLGLIVGENPVQKNYKEKIQKYITKHIGTFAQQYPPFSSKTINGIPLFELSKKGVNFEIPTHKVTLYSAEIIDECTYTKEELHKRITELNSTVTGDFRQEEITSRWNDFFEQSETQVFPALTLRMHVGSGFYVRQFVHDIGRNVGSGAIAMYIKRTKILDIT